MDIRSTLAPLAALALASPARAQVPALFSIADSGQTIAQPATNSGASLRESDLLFAAGGAPTLGPRPRPSIAVDGQQLGLAQYSLCVEQPPQSIGCGIEVDALSSGDDDSFRKADTESLLGPATPSEAELWFSVDRFAIGAVGAPPSVASEGAGNGAFEAGTDVFVDLGLPLPPVGPAALVGSVGALDGNGLPSASGFAYRGVGLVEPTGLGPPPHPGDDLDGLSLGAATVFPVWFSLEGALLDPLTGLPGSGAAGIAGFSGADIVVTAAPGTSPAIYASAAALGLSAAFDDVDALVLRENGLPGFQPSLVPGDWDVPGGPDMLLFSVRRGSGVIGVLDSLFGVPIEEGDLLTTPIGGVGPPAIYIAAESIGLATVRSGTAMVHGDDLDAADVEVSPCFDCNDNGIEDAVDIANGSPDANGNGIPDECESRAVCFCPAALAPCGNADAAAGCANSTGAGGLLAGAGTNSLSADDFELHASQLPPSIGLFFTGTAGLGGAPFGDGLRCVRGSVFRLGTLPVSGGGTVSLGPGIAGYACSTFPAAGCPMSGQTWNYQFWYRNNAGPCGSGFNLTNAVELTWGP